MVEYGAYYTKNWLKWRLKNLTTAEIKVFDALIYFFNPRDKKAFPSQETLSEMTGYSHTTISKACNGLHEKGIVHMVRKPPTKFKSYRGNDYYIKVFDGHKIRPLKKKFTADDVSSIIKQSKDKNANK